MSRKPVVRVACVGLLVLAGCTSSKSEHAPSNTAPETSSVAPRPAKTATAAPKAISLTSTAIKTFKPTDSNDDLRSDIKITERLHGGSCSVGSETAGGDGFRCFSGDDVLDPCFPTFTAGVEVVTCPPDPWSNKVVEMFPDAPLPTLSAGTGEDDEKYPWGIELADGAKCSIATGAGDTYKGQKVSYYCGRTLALAGAIGGQGKLHTISVLRVNPKSYHYTFLGIYEIATEWQATVDSTEPQTSGHSLVGPSVEDYITGAFNDDNVECPDEMPLSIGATYQCTGTSATYAVTILSDAGKYTVDEQ